MFECLLIKKYLDVLVGSTIAMKPPRIKQFYCFWKATKPYLCALYSSEDLQIVWFFTEHIEIILKYRNSVYITAAFFIQYIIEYDVNQYFVACNIRKKYKTVATMETKLHWVNAQIFSINKSKYAIWGKIELAQWQGLFWIIIHCAYNCHDNKWFKKMCIKVFEDIVHQLWHCRTTSSKNWSKYLVRTNAVYIVDKIISRNKFSVKMKRTELLQFF